jgi:hypothetical protein
MKNCSKSFLPSNTCSRMSSNGSQISHTPSEPLINISQNNGNMDQLLCFTIEQTQQPLVPLNPTNMIPDQSLSLSHMQQREVQLTRQNRIRQTQQQQQQQQQYQQERQRIQQAEQRRRAQQQQENR